MMSSPSKVLAAAGTDERRRTTTCCCSPAFRSVTTVPVRLGHSVDDGQRISLYSTIAATR